MEHINLDREMEVEKKEEEQRLREAEEYYRKEKKKAVFFNPGKNWAIIIGISRLQRF